MRKMSEKEMLKESLRLLNIVFSYDGDVFRMEHNAAVDLLFEIEAFLKQTKEKKG